MWVAPADMEGTPPGAQRQLLPLPPTATHPMLTAVVEVEEETSDKKTDYRGEEYETAAETPATETEDMPCHACCLH